MDQTPSFSLTFCSNFSYFSSFRKNTYLSTTIIQVSLAFPMLNHGNDHPIVVKFGWAEPILLSIPTISSFSLVICLVNLDDYISFIMPCYFRIC